MDERDDAGVPANGLPTAEAIERERTGWDEDKTVRERLYETALTVREPTTVAEIADRTDCATESARRHLQWFAEIGIVERVGDGQPARYRRNEAYFEWKRADGLRRELSTTDLADRLDALFDRDRTYQERYGVPEPSDVSAFDHADPGDHDAFESVLTDVNDWLSVREEVRITEQDDDSGAIIPRQLEWSTNAGRSVPRFSNRSPDDTERTNTLSRYV